MSGDLEKLQRSARDLARWQKAQQELLTGRASLALGLYVDLVQKFPGVPALWFELGLAAAKELDFDRADGSFARATELVPKDISMLVLLGQQYHQLRRLDKARACFQAAVTADPRSIHARLSLADWFERERRLEDAWECVESCDPHSAQVQCFKARLLHAQGKNTEAELMLRDLIKNDASDLHVKFASRHQLAVVLDALGQYVEALHWLGEAKAQLRQTANISKMEQDYDRADRRRRDLLAALTPAMIQRWQVENFLPPSPRRLAFLGGHPRTGTTLLEQILGAHPGIAAFDEPPAFTQEILEKLAPLNSPVALTLKTLEGLPDNTRANFRQRYLKSLLREGSPAADTTVLLDKNPSPTASLHLWLRLFPGLKAIIALRDPRDVIVSCYFQNLMLNPTNANFLRLERTAKHYADLMDVWLRLRELGGFEWIETRYEDVVANLESEGRRATEFLGLAWHPQQAAFHEGAHNKFVFSPTYKEVAKPVHQRAVGRWRNYETVLAPLQEKLAPYCRAFGYT